MENKTRLWQMISGVFIIISIGAISILLYVTEQNKLSVKDKDQKITTLTKQNKALDSKYNELYEQKNGNANEQLVLATKGVFSSIFNYDTKKDTIKDRREKASKFTTEEALETIFPKEATSYNISVQTVSKLKGEPQIFYAPTNDKKQKVLIIVDNAITIAGSEPQEATFMYQAEFDPIKNQFTSLKNAGTLNE